MSWNFIGEHSCVWFSAKLAKIYFVTVPNSVLTLASKEWFSVITLLRKDIKPNKKGRDLIKMNVFTT